MSKADPSKEIAGISHGLRNEVAPWRESAPQPLSFTPREKAVVDPAALLNVGTRCVMPCSSRPMGNIFRSRRSTQASLKRSERFTPLRGDPVAITFGPIPLKVGIIKRPFIFHAAFLHDPSGSDVRCFTFRDDSLGSQNRKLIGKDRS